MQAIERHASRYGVPGKLFIDNGTLLKVLEHAMFSTRDIGAQVFGIRVHISNAKIMRNKVRLRGKSVLREMLEKLGIDSTHPSIQWETIFLKVSSAIDDLPLARGDSSKAGNLGFEIITANRLKLGRNNKHSLEVSWIRLEMNENVSDILERNRAVYSAWYQIFMDNIHEFMVKPDKFHRSTKLLIQGDIVLFSFSDSGYGKSELVWKLGPVEEVSHRKISVKYVSKIL